MYRYRRLAEARAAAGEAGYRGAMFPWQSGSDGTEETQVVHLNPLSGRWDRTSAATSGTSTRRSSTTSGSTTRPPTTCEFLPTTAPR